jgi:RNA polymerase sigma factor (sigma-70 family)
MIPDAELLQRYMANASNGAFAELMRRHLPLVYQAALRQLNGDAHLAQDVSQEVFTAMARNAPKLVRHPSLSGWLYVTACYAARRLVRKLARQRLREEKAGEPLGLIEAEAHWGDVREVIDDALLRLNAADREAVLLRFFEGLRFSEISAKLGLSEDGARLRVDRALDKIRRQFTRRGIVTSAAALGAALTTQSRAATPAGLAEGIEAAVRLQASGAPSSAIAFNFMVSSKAVFAGVGAIVLVVGAAYLANPHAFSSTVSQNASASIPKGRAEMSAGQRASRKSETSEATATIVPETRPANTDPHAMDGRAELAAAINLGTIPIRLLADAGNATPHAAVETFVWAIAQGTRDDIARQLVLTPAQRAELGAILATLPETSRPQYPDAEHLMAASAAFEGTIVPADGVVQILSENATAQDATLSFRFVATSPVQAPLDGDNRSSVNVKSTPAGWKIAVPDEAMKAVIDTVTRPSPAGP